MNCDDKDFNESEFYFDIQDVCLLYILTGSVSVLQQNIGFPGSKSPSEEVARISLHKILQMKNEI